SFILSRDVVTGKILAPACGPTRTEADFLAHLQAVVATDPEPSAGISSATVSTPINRNRWCVGWPNAQGSKRTWASKGKVAFSHPWWVEQRFSVTRLTPSCSIIPPSTVRG